MAPGRESIPFPRSRHKGLPTEEPNPTHCKSGVQSGQQGGQSGERTNAKEGEGDKLLSDAWMGERKERRAGGTVLSSRKGSKREEAQTNVGIKRYKGETAVVHKW